MDRKIRPANQRRTSVVNQFSTTVRRLSPPAVGRGIGINVAVVSVVYAAAVPPFALGANKPISSLQEILKT